MSIEQKLDDLTSAIRELTAAITGSKAAAPVVQETPPEGKPSAAQKKDAPAPEPAAPPTPAAAAESAVESPSEEPARELDYDKDVKPLFLKLINKKGRDTAVALIKEFDESATKLNEAVKPEQFAEVVARIEELLK
jgi:hypothetical protein